MSRNITALHGAFEQLRMNMLQVKDVQSKEMTRYDALGLRKDDTDIIGSFASLAVGASEHPTHTLDLFIYNSAARSSGLPLVELNLQPIDDQLATAAGCFVGTFFTLHEGIPRAEAHIRSQPFTDLTDYGKKILKFTGLDVEARHKVFASDVDTIIPYTEDEIDALTAILPKLPEELQS